VTIWLAPKAIHRPAAQARSDSILAPPNSTETKSALHDETWNWCWNIGNGLLPVSQGTDHQRAGSRSSRSPDGPASSAGERAAADAPSAIAVVDPAGDLLAFQRMDGVRPASADLAIEKARTAARLRRPTAEIEDSINQGRTAFVTANIAALRGGVPLR